jgi:hypothetical protein
MAYLNPASKMADSPDFASLTPADWNRLALASELI